jgi:hypothetical protein
VPTVPNAPVDPAQAALSALDAGQIQKAEQYLNAIDDPAAQLFIQARIEWAKGDPKSAVQTNARLVAVYYNNEKWIAKSELMSAKLYVELGMLHAADVTARQVQALHEGTAEATEAAGLRIQIEKRMAEKESEGSAQ